MNIETAKAYLETAHMNRKVAKYLIDLIDELQSQVEAPKKKDTLFNKKFNSGYNSAMAIMWNILHKEV